MVLSFEFPLHMISTPITNRIDLFWVSILQIVSKSRYKYWLLW